MKVAPRIWLECKTCETGWTYSSSTPGMDISTCFHCGALGVNKHGRTVVDIETDLL